MPSASRAIPKSKRITVLKINDLWIFKHFFGDWMTFRSLADYYNKAKYRFELKSLGEMNEALKVLEGNGFDYDLVEDVKGYLVQLPKSARYAQILKNSVAHEENDHERIFLMKDLAAVEEAVSEGAEIYEGLNPFD